MGPPVRLGRRRRHPLARYPNRSVVAGGKGMDDPASAFWAVRFTLPTWAVTGDTPEVPDLPAGDPTVVY